MRVGRPRVRPPDAGQQRPQPRARRRPQPERAVDVHPRAVPVGDVADLPDRVDGAGVDVADLRAHDRRAVVERLVECTGERVHPHPPLGVGGDRLDRRGADAEEAQRPVDGAVPLLAREHADPRGTPQPRRAHVPSGPAEHGVQRGRQPGEVGHLRAGHEPDRRVRWQAEQVGRPGARDLLDHGRGGPEDVQARVLVPRGGQPVGGQRRGRRTSDDEAEEPAAARRDHPGPGRRGQVRDHVPRVERPFGQRTAERGAQLREVGGGMDRPVGQAVEVGHGLREGLAQRALPVRPVHGAPPSGSNAGQAGARTGRPAARPGRRARW